MMVTDAAATRLAAYLIMCPLAAATAGEISARDLEQMLQEDIVEVEASVPGVRLTGYLDVNYVYGSDGGATDSGANGSALPNYVTGEDSGDFSVSAVRIMLERPLPRDPVWAAGFKIDLYAGEFGKYIGDTDPGMGGTPVHIETAYAQARFPVGNGVDIQFGKWPTLLGYETLDKARNNQVTLGLLPRFMEHSAATGALLLYQFTPRWGMRLGLCNGRNASDSDFLDGSDFAKQVTGGTMLFNKEYNAWVRFVFAYSPEGDRWAGNVLTGAADGSHIGIDGRPLAENDGLLALTFCGNWKPLAAGGKLELAFNLECVNAEDNLRRLQLEDGDPIGVGWNNSTTWGAALFARYTLLPWFHISTRLEYLHSDDGTMGAYDQLLFVGDDASLDRNMVYVTGADLYSATLTARADIADDLEIRLEYRADLASADDSGQWTAHVFGGGRGDQHTVAVQAIYKFW